MNAFLQFMSMPILAFLVQATIVTGLALLAGRLMAGRGAAFRIAVYRAAVLSVLALVLVGPAMRGFMKPIIELGAGDAPAASGEPNLVLPPGSGHARPSSAPIHGTAEATQPKSAGPAESRQMPAGSTQDPHGPSQIFTLIYIAGVATVSSGILAGAVWLLRLRARCIPYGETPLTFTSTRVKSAFTAGAMRPTIYLPADIDARYSVEVVEAILRHEQTHIAQRDCLWTLLARLACAVSWICPFSWVLVKKLREDSEELCDKLVLESGIEPAGYAGCLLKIAESFVYSPAERYVGAGVVTVKSQLTKRISLMLNSKSNPQPPVSRAGRFKIATAFVLTLCAATAVISASPLAGSRRDETPEITLKAFYAAMNMQDWEGVFSRIEGAKMDVIAREIGAIPKTPHSVGSMVKPTFSNVSIKGATATVTVELEPMTRGGQKMEDEATLHNINGNWKIVGGRDAHGMLEQISEAARDPAKLKKARLAAKKSLVFSNFKQLALATILYITDNNDKFTLTQAKLHDALRVYTKTDALWLDADQKPMDVRLNPRIIGKSLNQISDPADCVMLSLGPKDHLQEIYGMVPVAYCDGHVASVTMGQVSKLSWK